MASPSAWASRASNASQISRKNAPPPRLRRTPPAAGMKRRACARSFFARATRTLVFCIRKACQHGVKDGWRRKWRSMAALGIGRWQQPIIRVNKSAPLHRISEEARHAYARAARRVWRRQSSALASHRSTRLLLARRLAHHYRRGCRNIASAAAFAGIVRGYLIFNGIAVNILAIFVLSTSSYLGGGAASRLTAASAYRKRHQRHKQGLAS